MKRTLYAILRLTNGYTLARKYVTSVTEARKWARDYPSDRCKELIVWNDIGNRILCHEVQMSLFDQD